MADEMKALFDKTLAQADTRITRRGWRRAKQNKKEKDWAKKRKHHFSKHGMLWTNTLQREFKVCCAFLDHMGTPTKTVNRSVGNTWELSQTVKKWSDEKHISDGAFIMAVLAKGFAPKKLWKGFKWETKSVFTCIPTRAFKAFQKNPPVYDVTFDKPEESKQAHFAIHESPYKKHGWSNNCLCGEGSRCRRYTCENTSKSGFGWPFERDVDETKPPCGGMGFLYRDGHVWCSGCYGRRFRC